MRLAFLVVLLFPALAAATDPPTATHNQNQNQRQTQVNNQSISARNAQDQGQQQFSENLSNSSVGDISPSIDTTFITVPNPTQPMASGCWKPGDGKERSWSVLVVATSGVLELDETCWAEYKTQAEHVREMDRRKMALEEARLELERSKLSREVSECRRERVVEGICK